MSAQIEVGNVGSNDRLGMIMRAAQKKKEPLPKRLELLTCDLKKMKRPISEDVIGYRLIFVIPNKAKWNMMKGVYETSYHKKYQVYWDGDFNEGNVFTVERFIDFLKGHNLDINRIKGDSETMQKIIAHVKSVMKK